MTTMINYTVVVFHARSKIAPKFNLTVNDEALHLLVGLLEHSDKVSFFMVRIGARYKSQADCNMCGLTKWKDSV